MELLDNKLHELYERLYFWEIERQDRINSRVPVLLVIILALAGFQSFLIEHLLPMEKATPQVIAGVLLLVSMACLIMAAIYVKLAWHGHAFAYMPPADRLEEHRKKLNEYCEDEANPEGKREKRSLALEFESDLLEYFVEDASCNFRLNKKKSLRFHVAFNWILISIATGVISFVVLKLKDGIWIVQ